MLDDEIVAEAKIMAMLKQDLGEAFDTPNCHYRRKNSIDESVEIGPYCIIHGERHH